MTFHHPETFDQHLYVRHFHQDILPFTRNRTYIWTSIAILSVLERLLAYLASHRSSYNKSQSKVNFPSYNNRNGRTSISHSPTTPQSSSSSSFKIKNVLTHLKQVVSKTIWYGCSVIVKNFLMIVIMHSLSIDYWGLAICVCVSSFIFFITEFQKPRPISSLDMYRRYSSMSHSFVNQHGQFKDGFRKFNDSKGLDEFTVLDDEQKEDFYDDDGGSGNSGFVCNRLVVDEHCVDLPLHEENEMFDC